VNDPSAISNAILRLLKNPEERQRLGRAAQETIKNEYTLDKMCVQYEKLLTAKESRFS
jgi:glycosyltransferase involved in cell wall biosynthesis